MDHFGAQKGGAASAFSIDQKTGKLTLLNQVATRGRVLATSRWTSPANSPWLRITMAAASRRFPLTRMAP